jgi:hypothetical protein
VCGGELDDLYCLPDVIRVITLRRMTWVGHVARMGRREIHTRFLVGKPEGRRPFGRSRHRWEHNIKMDLKGIGSESV